jgi:phosphoribosylaminoimidazole-succinocarboxamide synthase
MKIPVNLQDDTLSIALKEGGLKRIHQGKVRDTYFLDEKNLLVVATDRISIFEFVLNASIPKKGEVLTALTHFWLSNILERFEHHLVKSSKYSCFNAAYDLRRDLKFLPIERCLVVKNLTGGIYPFELIYRHHIGGSVFKKYQETGMAGGHKLPPNLPKWSKLEKPIFTPSTKEEIGHDVNVDADYFFREMERKGLRADAREAVEILRQAYSLSYEYAESRGISILDTKFEVAGMVIADEILTPDSSRFARTSDWEKAMAEGRDPYFLDKQPVRDWGLKIETPFRDKNGQIVGINKLDPKKPEHVTFVHGLEVPAEVIASTTKRYLNIFEALTDSSLSEYQVEWMGV